MPTPGITCLPVTWRLAVSGGWEMSLDSPGWWGHLISQRVPLSIHVQGFASGASGGFRGLQGLRVREH